MVCAVQHEKVGGCWRCRETCYSATRCRCRSPQPPSLFRDAGFEPARISPHAPQACASANFASLGFVSFSQCFPTPQPLKAARNTWRMVTFSICVGAAGDLILPRLHDTPGRSCITVESRCENEPAVKSSRARRTPQAGANNHSLDKSLASLWRACTGSGCDDGIDFRVSNRHCSPESVDSRKDDHRRDDGRQTVRRVGRTRQASTAAAPGASASSYRINRRDVATLGDMVQATCGTGLLDRPASQRRHRSPPDRRFQRRGFPLGGSQDRQGASLASPAWLRDIMSAKVSPPYKAATDHAQTIVRAEFERCCKLAKIDRLNPIQLRQRAVTEWTRANATAGKIVHGCGLGILNHYIEPLTVLESAASRVRLPQCFGVVEPTGEESLLCNFRRLDPAAKGLVAMTAERLVG